jgi:CDP-diacylglycerol--glycerol-3-phosphate 3-phosphatidyltransferase
MLMWRLAIGAILAGLALAAGTALLGHVTLTSLAWRWSLGAATALCFEFGFCYHHLGANRAEGGTPFPTVGAANAITLVRGGLLAVVAGCLLIDPDPFALLAWLPAVCYGANAALDALDGTIARVTDRVTVLGTRLDMAFDTLGFLIAPIVGVLWGQLPVWYLSLSAARYLFKAGRGLRRYRGKPVYDLPTSRLRQPLAGVQMAFITVALAPMVPFAPARIGAAVVVLPSLVVFLRDYLAVSGRLHNSQE